MERLRVREDGCEEVQYTSPNLPVYSVLWRLSQFPGYAADCHWHQDLEFIIVLDGEMAYHVNDRIYPLRAGDGIFVNTNRLHFGSAGEHGFAECVFHSMLLHPSLLRAHPYIENRFVNPLLYDSRFDTLLFSASGGAGSPEADWRGRAFERIRRLAELTLQTPDESALEVQSQFCGLMALLYANTAAPERDAGDSEKIVPYRDDRTVKQMLIFIQKHFSEKITLGEIADAGMVCRSKCCRLFKQALKKSVFEYLLHFRIRQSLSLLANGEASITEVALASGFSAASYYGEIFKRIIGISPGEYRGKFRG
jgi:AraC-like DNA-binding protein